MPNSPVPGSWIKPKPRISEEEQAQLLQKIEKNLDRKVDIKRQLRTPTKRIKNPSKPVKSKQQNKTDNAKPTEKEVFDHLMHNPFKDSEILKALAQEKIDE